MSDINAKDYADSIVRTVREPLLVLDADLRVRTASRSFYEFFKVSPEETVGQVVYELGDGQWKIAALRKHLEQILPTNDGFDDFPVDYSFPGVGQRRMLLNARRLQELGRGTRLILLAFEDITERRRLEAEVERQREWLHVALSSIGDAVITTDARKLITFMNPTAEAITGWASADAVGKPLEDVFHVINEKTRKTGESPVTKAIRESSVVGLANHTVLIARDGSERNIDDSAAPILDERGNITGVIMVFHDVTRNRQLQQSMEISEVRFRRLFETARDGILLLDSKAGTIEDANPFLAELLGFPRAYFIGKQLWEIGVLPDAAASHRAMETLLRDRQIRYENLPLEHANGRLIPVEFISNVYQEGDHTVIQCNIRDIRERQRHDREREALLASEQAARMEAEAANRMKDLFLATLSHEMRTPLNAIVGWASLLKRNNYDDPDMVEGIDAIDRSAKSQARLIEDVLDVSRIVSGKLRLEIHPCQLVKVIAAAVEVVQSAADAKGIRIEVVLDPTASEVSCDPNRIQQVIWNLLSNAVKFTAKGGAVRITLGRGSSTVRIQVTDDGRGIEPEFLPYVFDRFRQADSTTRRKFGGLGLGLSIAKQLMELHGGTIKVESAGIGCGAIFTIDLPIRAVKDLDNHSDAHGEDKEPTRSAEETDMPQVRLDGLRVLIVDDEPDARRAVSRVLEKVGAIVTVADTVDEALRLIARSRPEVLVSDIAMPDQDGYDLIRKLRSSGHNARDLPAVALTAFAHKDDQRRALLAGFQVHVAKPVDPHDLTVVIASLVGRTGVA